MLLVPPSNTFLLHSRSVQGLQHFLAVTTILLSHLSVPHRQNVAAMIHSMCRSSEDLSFLTASPSAPPELISDYSSDDESGPASSGSFSGLSTPPDDNLQLYPLERAHVDANTTLESPVRNTRRRRAAYKPRDLPTIEHVLSDPDHSDGRGRGRIRRCPNVGSIGGRSRSPVSPDRFIPPRAFADPPSTPFRVCKNPKRLSPDEKLLRRRLPSADPFLPTRRRRANTAPRPRVYSPHYGPHLVNDSAIAGSLSSQESGDPARQVSLGAVWNVGGTSVALNKSSLAIPDGTGGLLSSGTTAPMHTAKFYPKRALVYGPEKHESRIALALDIDPASRLLNTCNLSPSPEFTPSPSSPDYERFSPFVWKDSAWKKAEREDCKFKCSFCNIPRLYLFAI